MIKKKSVTHKVYPGKSSKNISTKGKKSSSKKLFNTIKVSDKKFNFVLKRLLFFGIFFIISFLLYFVSGNEFAEEIFAFSSIIFGFIAIAYLIVFLIFVFMRFIKK